MTDLAEDDGLGDGDGSVDVADGLEPFFSALTQHVELLDGVQSFLLFLQPDDVGVQDDALGEAQHRLFKGGGEEQHLTALRQHLGGDREKRRRLRVCSSSPAGRAEREFWPLDLDALLLVLKGQFIRGGNTQALKNSSKWTLGSITKKLRLNRLKFASDVPD